MLQKKYILNFISFFFIALQIACNGDKNDKAIDTPTTGEINIGVDESFQPLIQAELDGFGVLYKQAKINAAYKSEGEVMQDLLKDSIRMAVVARPFSDAERTAFKTQTITPREYKIAVDAVCLIINKQNKDSILTVSQVKSLFLGQIAQWNQLSKTNLKDSVRIIFDHNNSSNLLYLKSKLGLPDQLGKHIFAVKSNAEVIEYVQNNRNAIGVIGINWITDSSAKEKELRGFMRANTVVAVVPDSVANGVKNLATDIDINQYYPYQANMAQKIYPFSRTVYVLSREARSGLATGFTSYILGDKGQRIVLKAGLLPFTMPMRLVEFRKEPVVRQ